MSQKQVAILAAVLALAPGGVWASDGFDDALPLGQELSAIARRAVELRAMPFKIHMVHDPFPNPAGSLEMIGVVQEGCLSLAFHEGRSKCYENAITTLAHPGLGTVTRTCTGLPRWEDQATCFSRTFANLQPLYMGYQSAKPVLRSMCTGPLDWQDRWTCFSKAVKRAGFREIEAACGYLSSWESRSKCFEKALQ